MLQPTLPFHRRAPHIVSGSTKICSIKTAWDSFFDAAPINRPTMEGSPPSSPCLSGWKAFPRRKGDCLFCRPHVTFERAGCHTEIACKEQALKSGFDRSYNEILLRFLISRKPVAVDCLGSSMISDCALTSAHHKRAMSSRVACDVTFACATSTEPSRLSAYSRSAC